MKKRFQVTIGPNTQKEIESLAAVLRKESGVSWTFVDVVESLIGMGLRERLRAAKLPARKLASVRE